MNKKAQVGVIALRELIIGFGFVEGLWLAFDINPESEILNAFISVFVELKVGSGYIFLLKVLPVISLIVTLLFIFQLGGWLGLLAVGLAFLGGLLISYFPTLSVILLLGALALGSVAGQD